MIILSILKIENDMNPTLMFKLLSSKPVIFQVQKPWKTASKLILSRQ